MNSSPPLPCFVITIGPALAGGWFFSLAHPLGAPIASYTECSDLADALEQCAVILLTQLVPPPTPAAPIPTPTPPPKARPRRPHKH